MKEINIHAKERILREIESKEPSPNVKRFIENHIPISSITVDQEALLRVDAAKCIRLTLEFFRTRQTLCVEVNQSGQLLSGYEEYLVAHTLGHTFLRIKK